MKIGSSELSWLGHAGFMITHGDMHIYIDPYEIGRIRPDADYIFITHSHYDHLSITDIDQIRTEDTVIIAPEECREKLDTYNNLRIVKTGDDVEIGPLNVQVVAAYNTDKKFHPAENHWVGYVIEVDGKRFYHAGDTDDIPELSGIEADVAMLPVSGVYVMDAKQAAQAVKKIKTKRAIPMHYGSIVGDIDDAKAFKKLSPKGVTVTILEKA